MVNRRQFLGTVGGAVAASIAAPALIRLTRKAPRPIAGGFVDDGGAVGHTLRDGAARSAARNAARTLERRAIVIVGAGIAGLSAAWELHRRGMHDFVVLELADQAGGNARFGANDVTAFPWAAHYVPVPGERAILARELFEELGVLRNGVWDERHLCFSPQERLYMHGEWHAGIEPFFALDRKGREDFRRFDERVVEFRASGEFTIPMALGVRRDAPLDRLTMDEWLRGERLASPALRWYVDYACRDDYGALARDTSAWAGIHYFASRAHDERGPLTWPEGNGWIVKRLLAMLGPSVQTDAPVTRIERERQGAGAAWRVASAAGEYRADAVIFAAPTFVAPYVVDGMPHRPQPLTYSPWLTANLTLDRWPTERSAAAAPPAWDNVFYDSPALGYVVATHQSLRARAARDEPTVWTYYWSLAEMTPAAGRRALATRAWSDWRDRILDDLARAHPDIRECVSRLDVMRHGHAMIRPTPGFLTAGAAGPEERMFDRLVLAHSDRSGLSLFEEAQYQGVMAARHLLRALG